VTTDDERPMILDAHCHIASTKYTPESFVWGAVANSTHLSATQKRKAVDLYLKKMHDDECDELVQEMDAAGIQHSVLLCADFTHALKDCPLTIAEMIRDHARVAQKHAGRLSVFAGIDLFERAVQNGDCNGFKVYPPCGFGPSDPGLFPFYEICNAHHLPVTVHIGPTSSVLAFDNGRPDLIDAAARSFPEANFILAHGSSFYVDECVMMCAFRPNVYLDVSGFEAGSSDVLRALFRRGINRKILFGTDFPVFRLGGQQKDFMRPLLDEGGALEDLRHDDLELILGGSAQAMLDRAAACRRSSLAAAERSQELGAAC